MAKGTNAYLKNGVIRYGGGGLAVAIVGGLVAYVSFQAKTEAGLDGVKADIKAVQEHEAACDKERRAVMQQISQNLGYIKGKLDRMVP